MSADPLQIALEHHRAGRLRQAEAGYRALLAENPANADALHWLGVLVLQAGHAAEALGMLRRAAELRPGEAAFWNNLGQGALAAGKADEAVGALERSAAADPRAETWFGLGLARLGRRAEGDVAAAVEAFDRALSAGLDSAELHYHRGAALLAAGRVDGAVVACREALGRKADYPQAHYQLAMAHRSRGEAKEVRKALLKAVELDSGFAQAWCALGALDLEAGNHSTAAGLYRRAIKGRPGLAAAHEGLARALKAQGKEQEAGQALADAREAGSAKAMEAKPLAESVAELEKRLTDPETAALHYILAAQSDIFPPSQVPTSLVAGLFDRYAERFDKHLTGKLHYRVPEMLAEELAAIGPEKKLDVLDMGCGTGLCGPLLRPFAATLAGVDLAPGMVAKSKERGVYDRVEVGELVETMRQNPRAFDLLVAADVLIYIGDLGPAFEAAAGALRPGGWFAFSVEAGAGERYRLDKATRRFKHSREYLRHLAAIHGFREECFKDVIGRYEKEQPVASFLVILRSQPGRS